jgi:hypothetical protein
VFDDVVQVAGIGLEELANAARPATISEGVRRGYGLPLGCTKATLPSTTIDNCSSKGGWFAVNRAQRISN